MIVSNNKDKPFLVVLLSTYHAPALLQAFRRSSLAYTFHTNQMGLGLGLSGLCKLSSESPEARVRPKTRRLSHNCRA